MHACSGNGRHVIPLIHLVPGYCGIVVCMLALDFMAEICNPAHFGKVVDLLLAVCMLVQKVADMLFDLGRIDYRLHD